MIWRTHKTAGGGPSFGAPRHHRPILSMQRPLLFRLLLLCPCPCQLLEHQWPHRRRGHRAESGRGCYRTLYLMHFPPTSNGMRSLAETPERVERTHNCLLPSGVRNDQLEAAYGQRQPAVRAAFTRDKLYAKWFFEGSHMKFMRERA